MWIFRKRYLENVRQKVVKKQMVYKAVLFVAGAFLSALSFNLFYVPNNFVSGGLGGIAIILKQYVDVDVNTVVLIGNSIFIILSLCTLGFKQSVLSIVGALTYTAFVYGTANMAMYMNFSFDNILLYVLAAGVVGGFGESLVYKAGFNTGGTSIPALVIQKYKKVPLGKVLRTISIVVITAGGITFGYTAIMYSLIITVISTYLVDKMLLGISDSKTFFIQTTKEDEVKEYILKIIESGVTEITTKGAFTKQKHKMLMCVVPTEKYSILKSSIQEIDPSAFIVVSDCYEVYGGTKRKKMALD